MIMGYGFSRRARRDEFRVSTTIKLDTMIKQRLPGAAWTMLLCAVLIFGAMPIGRADIGTTYPQVRTLFPTADRFGESEGDPPASAVYANNELIGYAFLP